MKWLLYFGILMAVILCPTEGTDVGKLIPVEVVAVSEAEGWITISADTGDMGNGMTMQAAIDDMKASAPGIIYLDTAEYLLLEKGMESYLNTAERHLKQKTHLCYIEEGIPLEAAANFLSVHKPKVTLKTVGDYSMIPMITEEMGRYHLVEK